MVWCWLRSPGGSYGGGTVAMEEAERQGSVVVMYGDLSLSLTWLSTYLYSLRSIVFKTGPVHWLNRKKSEPELVRFFKRTGPHALPNRNKPVKPRSNRQFYSEPAIWFDRFNYLGDGKIK
jgi:hypothetical protein